MVKSTETSRTQHGQEQHEQQAKRSSTRREFLQKAGVVAGGLGLLTLPPGLALAQTPTPTPTPDPNENCNPPGYNPNASQPMPNPVPFKPDPKLPLRNRKSVWDLNPTELSKLVAAYQALRALPATDPRGWLPQAHVHCYYCAGSQDFPTTIEIHGGWFFFPWHRCYLYFHERILGSLIGDPTFALPYWDWDDPSRTLFPTPYGVPNNPGNPLFDAVREATPTSTPTLDAVFQQYWPTKKGGIAALLQETDYELFMGTSPDTFNNYGGHIENGPHGLVHLWVGQPSLKLQNSVPDMGVLQTAARDPVFFAHHCNIDRLWHSWVNGVAPATAPHDDPTDCAWMEQRWNFFDENKQWTSISVADVVSTENSLHYTYGATPPSMLLSKSQARVLLATPQAKTTQTPEPTTKEIPVPDIVRQQVSASAKKKRGPNYILHIDGIEVPSHESAIVKVFVNLPRANANTSTTSKAYVGMFTVLPKTVKPGGHVHRPMNVAFNITEKLAALVGSASKLTVTLVPTSGVNEKPLDIHMTYQQVYITTKE